MREKRLDVEVAIHVDKIEFVFDTGKAILKDVYTLDNSTSLQDAEKRFSEKLLGMLLSHGLLAWENAAKVPNDI